MTTFLWFLLTLAVATAAGLLFQKLRIPAGGLLGALLAVAALNITTHQAVFYEEFKLPLQIMAGAMIGGKISREDLRTMRTLIKPVLILVGSMIVLNLVFGGAILLTTDFDIPTALFASAPGGVADMALIASDLNADTTIVALLQLLRVLIVVLFFPPIFKKLIGRMHAKEGHTPPPKPNQFSFRLFLLLILVATALGLLFDVIGVAAGALVGGMIGGAVVSLVKKPVYFTPPLRIGLQVFAGAFIGIGINRDTLTQLPTLWIPALIMLVGIFVFSFGITYILHRFTGLPYDICLLSSTPAGLQEMALLSEELGVDTVKVSVLQTIRLFSVILLFPTMISVINLLFGSAV